MVKQLNVGLIGYGFAGKTFHAPFIVNTPGMNLAVVSSSNPEKVTADYPDVAVVSSPDDVFADPNIHLVVIPTPNDTHFPLAQKAIAAGKHVVVDKPFTLTVEQAEQLCQQAKEAGVLLSVYHNRRFDSGFLTLKSLLDENKLGDIKYYESHFDRFRPEPRVRWRESADLGGGIWFDLGPHLLDQAVQLFGQPSAITASLEKIRPNSQAVDYFHVQLHYPTMNAVLHATTVAAAESPVHILHGMKGSYVKFGLDPQENALKAGQKPSQLNWGHDSRDGEVTLSLNEDELLIETYPTVAGDYGLYYKGIYEAICDGKPTPVSAEQAVGIMKLIEAGIRSHETKMTVTV